MKKPTLLLPLATTTAGWLAMSLPAAESAGAGADEQTIKEELTAREDPTILTRRAWLETQWDHFKNDSDNVELTLGGLWAWRISTNLDWAVRLKVPFEFHFAGDAAGDSDGQGLGDIKLATGTAYRFNESWRAGGGIELRFPSASDSDLGDNTWRIMEFGTVAWDATRWLTLSPSLEYNQSYEEQQDGAPVHFLEMFFPAIFVLPRLWSMTAKYEAKVDFEDDNDWTHTANFAVRQTAQQRADWFFTFDRETVRHRESIPDQPCRDLLLSVTVTPGRRGRLTASTGPQLRRRTHLAAHVVAGAERVRPKPRGARSGFGSAAAGRSGRG